MVATVISRCQLPYTIDRTTPGVLPHILLLLSCWRTVWGVLRGCRVPSRLFEVVAVLPVLDFLHPNLAFNQLVHIRHNHRALNIHQRKRRRRLPEICESASFVQSTTPKYTPVPQPSPGASCTARVHEEPAVIFDSLESGQMITTLGEQTAPENARGVGSHETYVCVCPEIKTSTSIWRAMALSESRSPVGMH